MKQEIEKLISRYENELKIVQKMIQEDPGNSNYQLGRMHMYREIINELEAILERG